MPREAKVIDLIELYALQFLPISSWTSQTNPELLIFRDSVFQTMVEPLCSKLDQ